MGKGSFQAMIMSLGMTVRIQTKTTTLNGTNKQLVGGEMQTNVGLIYGIVHYADTVDPTGNVLITTTQATQLWMEVTDGQTQYAFPTRLDDFLNVFAGSPLDRSAKYTEVLYTGAQFRFDQSNYYNPTGITGVNILMNYYYINHEEYQELIDRGLIYHKAHPDNDTRHGKKHRVEIKKA